MSSVSPPADPWPGLADRWDLLPIITEVGFHPGRTAFSYPTDTYPDWGLLTVDEGRFEYEVGEERGECTFGEYVLCPPGTPLGRRAVGPLSFYFMRFHLVGLDGRRRTREDGPKSGRVALRDRARLSADLARLSADLALLRVLHPYRNDPEGRRLASHVVKDLLLLPALESLERPASSISDPLVAEACRRLETEFSGEVSLGRLAAELGLRPVQFTRRFAAVLGRTPLEHLTLLRLERARGLLLETDLPLEAVARRCGYSSGFYLSRLFSAREGISPSEFRRQRRV